MKKVILLLFPMLLSATMVGAQTFAQCINEAEARMKKLKEAEQLVASSIQDTDAVMRAAQQTSNPQQFMDFVLLRFERNMRKVQLAMAQSATQYANRLCAFIGKSNVVNQVVLAEGIDKYTDMASFHHKYSNELEESFFEHFSSYLNNYGYDCKAIFSQDNTQLLLEYEIY